MKTILYLGISAALVFAKLAGVIGWPWWVVTLPLVIPAAFFVLVAACAVGVIVGLWAIIVRKH